METISTLYVLDEEGLLIHDVRLGVLVLADPASRTTDIA